jgi:hypothetical protein
MVARKTKPPAPSVERRRETALYAPVKAFLEGEGYEVKGEVDGCDVVARRGDEPPVIVELKLRLSLALVLQGVDRLAVSERVYLAVPRPARGRGPDLRAVRRLCRRLGLGLLLIAPDGAGIDILAEPEPYRPRRAPARARRLAREFARRVGDLNIGGRARGPIVTSNSQDALRVARVLAPGPLRLAELRSIADVPTAARILQRNVYGWFARPARATYALTDAGSEALARFAETLAVLAAAASIPPPDEARPMRPGR